LIKKGI